MASKNGQAGNAARQAPGQSSRTDGESIAVQYRGRDGVLITAGQVDRSVQREIVRRSDETVFSGVRVQLEWRAGNLSRILVPDEKSAQQIVQLWERRP